MSANSRSRLLQRSPRPSANADAEATSLWICSWLKVPEHVLNRGNGENAVEGSAMESLARPNTLHSRRDLALSCESTRERLEVLLAVAQSNLALFARGSSTEGSQSSQTLTADQFVDADGTEFLDDVRFYRGRCSPIQQLVLIVVFCLGSLYWHHISATIQIETRD